MDFRNVKKDLAKAQGKGADAPAKLCLVTVIGTKLNGIVLDLDCPPSTVYAMDERAGKPTDEQRAECIRLWAENTGAPSTYEFPEDGWPDLQKELRYQESRGNRYTPQPDTNEETSK